MQIIWCLEEILTFWNVNMDILDAKMFQQHKLIDFKDIKDIFWPHQMWPVQSKNLFLGFLYSFNRLLVYQYIWYGSTQDSQVSNTNILSLHLTRTIHIFLPSEPHSRQTQICNDASRCFREANVNNPKETAVSIATAEDRFTHEKLNVWDSTHCRPNWPEKNTFQRILCTPNGALAIFFYAWKHFNLSIDSVIP